MSFDATGTVGLMSRMGPSISWLATHAGREDVDAEAARRAYDNVVSINQEWLHRSMTPNEHVEWLLMMHHTVLVYDRSCISALREWMQGNDEEAPSTFLDSESFDPKVHVCLVADMLAQLEPRQFGKGAVMAAHRRHALLWWSSSA